MYSLDVVYLARASIFHCLAACVDAFKEQQEICFDNLLGVFCHNFFYYNCDWCSSKQTHANHVSKNCADQNVFLTLQCLCRNLTDEEKLMHFNGIFDQPLVHLGPYLVGILFGFFAFSYEKKVRIHSALVTIGWITSVVLFALLMLSSFKIDNVDPWLKQSFATISHTFWSLVLLWICFASMAGCGGKPYWRFSIN